MKRRIPALLLLLAAQASAQSFASMGRLFTTPAERAQLDAQRSQAPANALGTGSAPRGAGIPEIPAGAPGAAGMGAATPCAAVPAPGCAPAGVAQGTVAAGSNAAAEAGQTAQEAVPGLKLDGLIRRSHGPSLLIVNGAVQPAAAGAVTRGAVSLQADGRSVVLKPGQRFDPATGEIHEAAR
jgi:hypothetical protein